MKTAIFVDGAFFLKRLHTLYKDKYSSNLSDPKWISKELANKSGAGPAYITSLEWLSERFFQVGKISKRSIFEIDDIKLLKDLHEETKLIQRDKTSYIYNSLF